MNKHFRAALVTLAVLATLTASRAQTGDTRRLVAETNHSTVQFSVPISEGLTRITGKFNEFTIDVDMAGNDIAGSRISAKIVAASINTGIAGRDEDLKTKDFFDTALYPEITFVTDKISKVDDGYVAKGQLQLHGVTRTIDLPFKITGQKGPDVIGFSSRCTIKRSDFKLGTEWKHTTDDHFIADEIGVEIDFWTRKPREKK